MNKIKITAGAIIAAAAMGAGTVAAASPAAAASIRSGASIMSAPTPYSTLIGGPIGDQGFHMICWTDAAWANGTNRWFYGNGLAYNIRSGRFNMMYGYVSAAQVYHQDVVGPC